MACFPPFLQVLQKDVLQTSEEVLARARGSPEEIAEIYRSQLLDVIDQESEAIYR